jgi:hypothetical protein
MVAECVCTYLHTEMVLYVVRHKASAMAASADTLHLPLQVTEGGEALPMSGTGLVVPVVELAMAATAESTLENMGINTGARLAERLLFRDQQPFRYTPVDIIRFISGPVWKSMFGKRIDKTRHLEGVFFNLIDNKFNWLKCSTRPTQPQGPQSVTVAPGFTAEGQIQSASTAAPFSSGAATTGPEGVLPTARDMLIFTVGVIRGVVVTLIGYQTMPVITSSVGSSGEVIFQLDFRNCGKV